MGFRVTAVSHALSKSEGGFDARLGNPGKQRTASQGGAPGAAPEGGQAGGGRGTGREGSGTGKAGLSESATALRYGITAAAARLNEAVTVLLPGQTRWRPLKGGGLGLIDRRGDSCGWALVPLDRIAPDGEVPR